MSWQILWSIIGLGCVLYGCLICSLRSGTSFFIVWLILGAFFFALAAAARLHLWRRLPTGWKAAAGIAVCVCAAVFLFAEAKIGSGFRQTGEENLDYLIVLGAQVKGRGPSIVLQCRRDTACTYLENNPDTICIVSGGQGSNEPWSEAEGMQRYLLEKGIPAERILQEAESRSTLENIENSMKLLDPETDRVGIVTNNFHVYRGCAIARRAGIRHVCGIAAPSRALFLPNNMFREFFGVVKDVLKGNMAIS